MWCITLAPHASGVARGEQEGERAPGTTLGGGAEMMFEKKIDTKKKILLLLWLIFDQKRN